VASRQGKRHVTHMKCHLVRAKESYRVCACVCVRVCERERDGESE